MRPTRHGEWRIIGTEIAVQQEAGTYRNFRQKLPGDAASLILRTANYSTLGFNTETVRKTKHGAYSLLYAYGFVFNKAYNHVTAFDYSSQSVQPIACNYSTLSFQYTYDKWTGYLQSAVGAYANGIKIGAVYRLR